MALILKQPSPVLSMPRVSIHLKNNPRGNTQGAIQPEGINTTRTLLHFPQRIMLKPHKIQSEKWACKASGSVLALFQTSIPDLGCAGITMAGAYSLVSFFDMLVHNKFLDQKLSRKLVHVLSGLLYVMAWPIFSSSGSARFFAVLVPFANLARLLVYGLSLAPNEGLVNAVSRDGKPEELLKGPMYYVLVLICCTVFFWRDSPIGMISIAMMSAGDGMADIMGRKFGQNKLPYNSGKSWAGSLSMFVFGFLISLGILCYFSVLGFLDLEWKSTVTNVAIIAMTSTFTESLPLSETLDDNILVPLTCGLLGLCLFPSQS